MTTESSPRLTARVAGVFYLLVFVTGIFALAGEKVVVPGNASATAANILAHESSYRLASVANLLATACYVVVTALFYVLLKPVNRSVSLTAAFFSLVGCAAGGAGAVFYQAPLTILKNAPYLTGVFNKEQLQALAFLFVRLSGQGGSTGLVFFGFYCLLIGYLVYSSTFLPRALGVGMVIAGIGWLTFLWPPLARALSPYNMLPGVIGEGALTIWLIAAGVNAERWRERAA
jgi:hypothetical protein